MLQSLLLMVYTFAAGVTSWLFTNLLFRDRPGWWRGVVAVAIFPVLIVMSLTGLGMAGLLTPHAGGVLMLVAGGALLAVTRRMRPARRSGGELRLGDVNRETVIACAVLAGVALPSIARALLKGPQFGYDDLSYHAPFVAQWMIDGRFSFPSFNYHAYFPFGPELFSLWFMLPVRSDTFVGIAGVYWIVAAATSTSGLAYALGRRVEAALTSGALVAVSSVVMMTALRFSANDLALGVVTVSGLTVLTGRANGSGVGFREGLVAGLLLGLGLASKVTLLPAVLVVMTWLLLGDGRTMPARDRLGRTGAFVSGIGLAGAYWYARTWIATGNPVFPGAIGPFPGPFGAGEQAGTKLITHLARDPAGTLSIALPPLTDWPSVLWLIAAAGYAGVGALMVARLFRGASQVSRGETLLFIVGLVLLGSYPFQPFSAAINRPDAPLTPEARFVITSFMAGVVLVSRWNARGWHAVLFWVIVAAAAWMSGVQSGLLCTAVAVGTWVCFRLVQRAPRIARTGMRPAAVVAIMAGGILLGSVFLQGHLEMQIKRRLFTYTVAGQELGALWKEVDKLPPGSRVASFGLAENLTYPLFGRSFTLRPAVADRFGRMLQPLHERWAVERNLLEWWPSDSSGSADLAAIPDALLSAGVTHVAVSRTRSGRWPAQAEALLPPRFTMLHSAPGVALFSVNR